MSSSKNQKSLKFPSRREFLDSCHPQPSLAFRKPFIDYIVNSSTSVKLYQKLIKCCKLFFFKNAILVIRDLDYETGKDHGKVWKYCTKVRCSFLCNHKEFNLTKLTCQIWITGRLAIIDSYDNNGIKQLLPKLYKCDAKNYFFVDVKMGLADLKLMSKSVDGCYLKYVCVTDENGNDAALEDLLEVFSSSVKVTVHEVYNYVKDYKKLVNICGTIKINELYRLQDDFDAEKFVALLEKSKCPSVIYYERGIDDHISTWRPVKDDEEEYYESTEKSEEDDESDSDNFGNYQMQKFETNPIFAHLSDDLDSDDSVSHNAPAKAEQKGFFWALIDFFSCGSKACM